MLARAARSRLRVGGVRVLRVHARDAQRQLGVRHVGPADHVRDRRRDRPHRAHARSPLRATATPGRCASATVRSTSTSTTCGGCCSTRWPSTSDAAARSRTTVWEGLSYFVDQAIERFAEPDQGIWEMRGDPQHFVASKVMCWVAVDRGLRLARERDDDEHIERWQAAAESMRAEILDQGVDERGVFVAALRHQGPRRVEPAHPDHGLPPRRRRAGARHRARDRRRAHPGRPRAALPGRPRPTTASPARRARSPSARSGWSRRSRSSVRSTVPVRCSRSCSRSPGRCTSTPRRSTCTPASTSATSRRRSRTSRSSTPGGA